MLLTLTRGSPHIISLEMKPVAATDTQKHATGEWGFLCFVCCVIEAITFIPMILKLLVLIQ